MAVISKVDGHYACKAIQIRFERVVQMSTVGFFPNYVRHDAKDGYKGKPYRQRPMVREPHFPHDNILRPFTYH